MMKDPCFIASLKSRPLEKYKANSRLVKRLKKVNKRKLDQEVHRLHQVAFGHIDCLDCGNCCRTISPIITDKDISRIAPKLKLKPSEFVERYLAVDGDQDYVFRQTPCPFLGADNYCAVYAFRPAACADYPHTDRPRFYQALSLSLKNTHTCPAVYEIFENLKTGGY